MERVRCPDLSSGRERSWTSEVNKSSNSSDRLPRMINPRIYRLPLTVKEHAYSIQGVCKETEAPTMYNQDMQQTQNRL